VSAENRRRHNCTRNRTRVDRRALICKATFNRVDLLFFSSALPMMRCRLYWTDSWTNGTITYLSWQNIIYVHRRLPFLQHRYSRLSLRRGDAVVAIINNLGGMSKLEELVVTREAVDQMGKVNVHRYVKNKERLNMFVTKSISTTFITTWMAESVRVRSAVSKVPGLNHGGGARYTFRGEK
jgi:hypothetical protein